MDKMREKFELYAKNNFICSEDSFKRTHTGVYYNYVYSKLDNSDSCSVNVIWKVWQASRAAMVVNTSELHSAGYHVTGCVYLSDVEDMLDKAGIHYE